jgi:hypothetical protein
VSEPTDTCAMCKGQIKEVDLTGTPFFVHKPRHDCITWHHLDTQRNLTHQAVPARGMGRTSD